MFNNKILLITGGTGSFGNATIYQFLNTDISEIRIFSRDEKKQDDMRKIYNHPKLKFYIGDVKDKQSLDNAMIGVDFIFHAGALKHVPSCEFFPIESVKTNILGAENVLTSAIQHNVKNVVVLSTDKAVYPINAMGMSKAMMEKIMIARSRNIPKYGTIMCGTRYGNIMGSRGSVIPLFIQQIKQGKTLTITNPNMTRFMMSLKSSVELVMFAFEHGVQGDMFVQKAPACTIEILAKALLELYEVDNEIKIIGTRHGEKLYESLVTKEEMIKAKDLGEYYCIPADNRDLNYNRYFSDGNIYLTKIKEYHSHNTKQLNIQEVKELLLEQNFIQKDIGIKKEDVTYEKSISNRC